MYYKFGRYEFAPMRGGGWGGDGGLHAGGDRLSTSILIVFENVIYVGRGVAGCGPRPITLGSACDIEAPQLSLKLQPFFKHWNIGFIAKDIVELPHQPP